MLKLGNLRIFSRIGISKVAIATAFESWKHLYKINNFCHPVTLAWFSIPVFYAFKGANCLYELKRDLSPVMLKERFN